MTLVHHYRVHSTGLPHAMFRGKYLAQLRLLLLTGDTTPAPERPLGDVSPQVTLVSSKTADSYARLRPPSEKSLGNAGLRVIQVSGNTEDSCARLRPPSERSLGNVGPRGSHVPDIPDDSHTWLRPPGRRQRSQRWIPNTAIHVAARLTKQDTRMAAGAVLMDGHPAMLPVSVDVSSIDIQKVTDGAVCRDRQTKAGIRSAGVAE